MVLGPLEETQPDAHDAPQRPTSPFTTAAARYPSEARSTADSDGASAAALLTRGAGSNDAAPLAASTGPGPGHDGAYSYAVGGAAAAALLSVDAAFQSAAAATSHLPGPGSSPSLRDRIDAITRGAAGAIPLPPVVPAAAGAGMPTAAAAAVGGGRASGGALGARGVLVHQITMADFLGRAPAGNGTSGGGGGGPDSGGAGSEEGMDLSTLMTNLRSASETGSLASAYSSARHVSSPHSTSHSAAGDDGAGGGGAAQRQRRLAGLKRLSEGQEDDDDGGDSVDGGGGEGRGGQGDDGTASEVSPPSVADTLVSGMVNVGSVVGEAIRGAGAGPSSGGGASVRRVGVETYPGAGQRGAQYGGGTVGLSAGASAAMAMAAAARESLEGLLLGGVRPASAR